MQRLGPFAIAGLLAVAFVILTGGGKLARPTEPITVRLGTLLERVGLGLSEIVVSGQHRTSDRDIYAELDLDRMRSIWLMDMAAVRRRLAALPWVRDAALKRVFPDRLLINIEEARPLAIWRSGSKLFGIDLRGNILGNLSPADFAAGGPAAGLPVIYGDGAPANAPLILAATAKLPDLRRQIALFEWVAGRRWTLHLATGRRILLPETGLSDALIELTTERGGRKLLDVDFDTIDMRVAGKVAVDVRR